MEEPFFINVGALNSGVWPGVTPEKAVLDCQIGFPPPETPQSILSIVRKIVKRIDTPRSAGPVQVTLGSLATSGFENKNNRLVNILSKAITRVMPPTYKLQTVTATGHCDLRHIQTHQGLPAHACLYGPGGGENPHSRDECYHLDHFVPVAQTVASAILDWWSL